MTARPAAASLSSLSHSGKEQWLACDSLLLVTARQANDNLYFELREKVEAGAQGAPKTLRKIGDCDAPSLIAAAVYAGHRYARELEEPEGAAQPLRDRAWPGL